MARRRIYPAGYKNMDISSKAYGTGTVQLLATGYQRCLTFSQFSWDGQHKDNQNRPILLKLTDAIMQSDGTSFYPSVVIAPDSSGASCPTTSVSIESNAVKLTRFAKTDSLWIGLFYFGTQFV